MNRVTTDRQVEQDESADIVSVLRRRWKIVLATTLLGAIVGSAVSMAGTGDPLYESRAFIVATRWNQRIEGMARLVESVVETNDYREALQARDDVAFPRLDTFERSMNIEPVRDTVAVWVEADAPSAELAERRANLAAEALVLELNGLGENVGVFSLEDRARAPSGPTQPLLSSPLLAIVGAVGGFIIGSGLVVALPSRRSVSSPSVQGDNVDVESRLASGDDDPAVERRHVAGRNGTGAERRDPNQTAYPRPLPRDQRPHQT